MMWMPRNSPPPPQGVTYQDVVAAVREGTAPLQADIADLRRNVQELLSDHVSHVDLGNFYGKGEIDARFADVTRRLDRLESSDASQNAVDAKRVEDALTSSQARQWGVILILITAAVTILSTALTTLVVHH